MTSREASFASIIITYMFVSRSYLLPDFWERLKGIVILQDSVEILKIVMPKKLSFKDFEKTIDPFLGGNMLLLLSRRQQRFLKGGDIHRSLEGNGNDWLGG